MSDDNVTRILKEIGLTPIEVEAMARLIDKAGCNTPLLVKQIKSSRGVNRTITDTGFFLDFDIECGSMFSKDFEINNVYATLLGLDNEVSFLLFIRDGVLSQLEGYTLGDVWPTEVIDFEFENQIC